MAENNVKRKLRAILATDIKGYSRMMPLNTRRQNGGKPALVAGG